MLGIEPGREVVRECAVGRANRSVIGDGIGGERGSGMRMGRLAGEAANESRCLFFARVGVKSGSSSIDRKREESRDSSSSSWKVADIRYCV